MEALLPSEPLDRGLSHFAQVLIGVTCLFTALAIPAVVLRLYLRRKFSQPIGLDDWLMVFALAVQLVFQTMLILVCVSGWGYPMDTLTVQQIIDMTKWSWLSVPFQLLTNITARISIAVLLVRIFGVRSWFKWLTYGYTGVLTALVLTDFVYVFCETTPLEASWDFRLQASKRISQRPHLFLIFISLWMSAVFDLMLPLCSIIFIWRLKLARHKKAGLMLVMAASIITTAAPITRAVLMADTVTGQVATEFGASDAGQTDKIFVIFGVSNIFAVVEESLLIILGSLPKTKAITKLQSFSVFSSSIRTVLRGLRSRTGSGSETKDSNNHYFEVSDSNVELGKLKQGSARNLQLGKPGTYHVCSVRGGHNDHALPSNPGDRDQANEITTTESYMVAYSPKDHEPSRYV